MRWPTANQFVPNDPGERDREFATHKLALAALLNVEDAPEEHLLKVIADAPAETFGLIGRDLWNQKLSARSAVKCARPLQVIARSGELMLRCPRATATVPTSLEPLVDFLRSREQFRIEQLPGRIALRDKIAFVERLSQLGVLRVID